MDERIRESISALMDNEANEIETQRLLSRLDEKELHEVWGAYHRISDVVQGEHIAHDLSAMNIADKVSRRIHDQTPHDVDVLAENDALSLESELRSLAVEADSTVLNRATSTWQRAASLATAACLVVAVFVAVGLDGTPPLPGEVAETVATVETDQPVFVESISPEQEKLLNEYLLRHSEHSTQRAAYGMMPLVRVASVNSVGI